MSNSLIVGYTTNDESRGDPASCSRSSTSSTAAAVAYTSFGTEPFTPNNELRYNTFQLQDNFTKFGSTHSLTFGGSVGEVPLGQRVLHLLQAERRTSTTRWPTSTRTPTATWRTRTGRRRR